MSRYFLWAGPLFYLTGKVWGRVKHMMAVPLELLDPTLGLVEKPPHENCTSIYIGNLDTNVNEQLIITIFSQIGPVLRCKMIHESGVDPYCFVEFPDQQIAQRAIATMNGRKMLEKHIKVNWATNAGQRKDTSSDHHIFVGDLSYEIDSDTLLRAFLVYGTISDVRVVREPSGKSKGYGFISFKNKLDAERAIKEMHGKLLGGRAIRTNWATRKGPYSARDAAGGFGGTNVAYGTSASSVSGGGKRLNFEEISVQATPFNCTLYVGGLPQGITEYELRPYFQPYGQIIETRIFTDKGYAFVKFATHEQATHAICQVNGEFIEGNKVKCSWGKESQDTQALLQQQQQYYQLYYQQYQQFVQPGSQYTPAAFQVPFCYSNQAYIGSQGQGGTATTQTAGPPMNTQYPMQSSSTIPSYMQQQ